MAQDSPSSGFRHLVQALEQEYERVCIERDRLKQQCSPSAQDDDEVAETAKARMAFKDRTVSFEGLSFPEFRSEGDTASATSSIVQAAPRSNCIVSLDTHQPPDTDGAEEEALDTPRAIRHVRGLVTFSDNRMRSSEEGERPASDPGHSIIDLHARWLDLYVANQMKGMHFSSMEPDGGGCQSNGLGSGIFDRFRSFDKSESCSRAEDEKRTLRGKLMKYVKQVPFGPQNNFNIAWNMLGAPILMHDAVFIPLQVGFAMDLNPLVIMLMVAYWILDIVIQFNMGYTRQNNLVLERKLVAKRYLAWNFWVDLLLVILDLLSLSNPAGDTSLFRVLRILRILRMLRLFKLVKVQEMFEDTFVDVGGDSFILLFAVVQTLTAIFLFAHFVACGWYFLGYENRMSGNPAWLDWLMEEKVNDADAYLHSMYWVVGHLVGGETNPSVAPVSTIERVYAVSLVGFSLLVMGSGISKMTNTIADLGRMHAEAKDTRRKLIQVLRASGADAHLTSRILRFGMHVFSRKASLTLEDTVKGLLSQALVCELTLCQRSRYLTDHPLFGNISTSFSEVFLLLCSQFNSLLFAESDVIFRENSMAECMYVTLRGDFLIEAGAGVRMLTEETHFSGQRCLSEISLFSNIVHMTTLKTASFGDAFTLTGDDFAMSVGKSPRCVSQVYLYATQYLAMLQELRRYEHDLGYTKVDFEITPLDFSDMVLNKLELHTQKQQQHRESVGRIESRCGCELAVDGFIAKFITGSCTTLEAVIDALPEVFGELHDDGIYCRLQMEQERHRSVAAMTSAICLLKDDFDGFTCSQGATKLAGDQWDELQRFVKWADLSKDMIQSMLVFLAIRGIGKAQAFLQAMDKHCRTPEDVMITLMHQSSDKLPSFEVLTHDGQLLVEKAFAIHRRFNFAQLLQGENTPSHVRMLQEMVEREGEHVLKFYLFSLVGVMCGLRGAESQKGSLFMDSVNVRTLMAGIHMLQKLSRASPCGIYWGYIGFRARSLKLKFEELEDMAIARLACLTRATRADVDLLQGEWNRLCSHDREVFTRHFVADGLSQVAIVFTFLPLYLANAKRNSNVGLYRALVVLVELIDHLESDGYLDQTKRSVLTVSLQDLAEFTEQVSLVSVFMAVHVHSSIVSRFGHMDFLVSAKHKQHTMHQTWKDDPTHEMTLRMRRMTRQVETVNKELERLQRSAPQAAAMLSGL